MDGWVDFVDYWAVVVARPVWMLNDRPVVVPSVDLQAKIRIPHSQDAYLMFRSSFVTVVRCSLTVLVAASLTVRVSFAQQSEDESIDVSPAAVDRSINRGIDFLRNRGQASDGSFSGETGAAVTGLCLRAILEHRPLAVNDPVVKKGLAYIDAMIQGDGGIYAAGSRYRNYETSVAIGALLKANQDGRYDSVLARAEAFLKDIQWDEGEGIETSDPAYGGAGYGKHERPDLSNTSFLIDALHELGNGSDDEAIQKALQFVARTQNLPGQGNDTEHATKVGDGGFYYTPAAGGQSQAGEAEGGGLRSYGSMTYAGLKSMIYAGVTADDPRVVAAMQFIRKHYSLQDNPGMGQSGLFYYYHTFGKTLDAAGIEVLDDAEGNPHAWREELARTLLESQQADGSWVNGGSDRWMEGDRQLVTAYALLALAHCKD